MHSLYLFSVCGARSPSVFISGIFFLGGGIPPPQKKLTIPQTAAKVCAPIWQEQWITNISRKLSFNGQ